MGTDDDVTNLKECTHLGFTMIIRSLKCSLAFSLTICSLYLTSWPASAHVLTLQEWKQLKSETRYFAHASSVKAKINKALPRLEAITVMAAPFSTTSLKGKMALFVFADTACPCVKAVETRMRKVGKKYGRNTLTIVYVFSKPDETPLQIARYLQKHNLPFTAIYDGDQRVLKTLNAQCSGELFLTDKRGVLRYHGRFDDSMFDEKAVSSRDLENAIIEVKAGRKVKRPEVPAMGCAIPRL